MQDTATVGRPVIGWERIRLCVEILAASFVGVAALAIAIEQPWMLTLTAGTVVLLGRVWHHRTTRRDSPAIRERMLIFTRMAGSTGISSLVGVINYWLAYWIVNVASSFDPAVAATWYAAFAFLVMDLMPAADDEVERAVNDLYPTQPGVLPVTVPQAWNRFGRVVSVLTISVALIALSSIVFGPLSVTTKILWFAVLLLNGSMATPVTSCEFTPNYENTIHTLANAMQDAGYHVLQNPITGDPDVDVLLSRIDLFADFDDQPPVVVDVRLNDTKLSWTDATPVLTAAKALGRWLNIEPSVNASMVLVNSGAPAGMADFADEVRLEIVEIDTKSRTISHLGPTSRLEDAATTYLESLTSPGTTA